MSAFGPRSAFAVPRSTFDQQAEQEAACHLDATDNDQKPPTEGGKSEDNSEDNSENKDTDASTSNTNSKDESDTEGLLLETPFPYPCCPEKEADSRKVRYYFLMGKGEESAFETIDFTAAIPMIQGTLRSSQKKQEETV